MNKHPPLQLKYFISARAFIGGIFVVYFLVNQIFRLVFAAK